MCGFALVVAKNRKALAIDDKILAYRGPDYTEELDFGWSRLRHWRLSIQDLTSNSNQPVNDEECCLAYNGELYDFKTIGNKLFGIDFASDTLLLFQVLKNGDFDELKYESGFYSFVFISKNEKSIFATRDFFGKKPLYYYLDDEIFILASQEDAIRKICNDYFIATPLSKDSIAHYFVYKDLHFGTTFFQGIREVAPGSTVLFERDNWTLKIEKTWDQYYCDIPFYKYPLTPSDNQSVTDIQAEVNKTISKRFVADVPIQLALSGGVDSTVVAISASNNPHFGIVQRALTVASDSRPTEEEKSRKLCTAIGLSQVVIDFKSIDILEQLESAIQAQGGPLSHPHALAYNILAKETRAKGKVLVTGEGADELFYGYEHYKESCDSTFAFIEHLRFEDYFELVSGGTYPLGDVRQNIKKLKNRSEGNDGRDFDVKTHLISLLRRNDRISMRNSIELRSAFLDCRLFSLVNNLHTANTLKKGKGILVDMIRNSFPSYAVDNKKIGFYVPFDEWFEEEFRENEKLRQVVNNAIFFLEDNFSLKIKSEVEIQGKLAWALVNIGIFIDFVIRSERL